MWQPTQTQAQEIITRYINGESLTDLEIDLAISRHTLGKFLREHGIAIRNTVEAAQHSAKFRRSRWRYEPQQKGV